MKKSLLCGLLATLITVNAVAQDSQNAPKSDTAQSTQTAVQSVLNSEQKDGILILTLNDLPRNATSIAVLQGIGSALDKAEKDDSISAIIITGTGKVFSAGAGGESLQGVTVEGKTHAELAYETFRRMEQFPKIIIGAINGVSAGGGNELALATDIRIAGKSAQFRQHELQAGLIPGFGGTQRLPRLIGRSKAMEMMLTGEFITAQEALNLGLVAKVVDEKALLPTAIKFAQQLNRTLNPKAVAVFKQRMSYAENETYDQALKADYQAFDKLATEPQTPDAIKQFIERQASQSSQ